MSELKTLLASGQVTNNGPVVRTLEHESAEYLGVDETIAVSNGSDALLLSALALGRRGKAILPSFTFIATLSAVVHAGLEPVFCDVDPNHWTMSVEHLRSLVRTHTDVSLIMPVTAYGVFPQLREICAIGRDCGAQILWDDAHGFGSQFNGHRHLNGIDIRTISLHATKALPAVEGGLIICQSKDLSAKIRQLRSHGLTDPVHNSTPGFNNRMDELCAAVGIHSLKNFDQTLQSRKNKAQRIRRHMERNCHGFFISQSIPEGMDPNFTNLAVRIPKAEEIGMERITDRFAQLGIGTRRYFYPALHRLHYFKTPAELPVTECLERTILCLPLHSKMSDLELDQIESSLTKIAGEFAS